MYDGKWFERASRWLVNLLLLVLLGLSVLEITAHAVAPVLVALRALMN